MEASFLQKNKRRKTCASFLFCKNLLFQYWLKNGTSQNYIMDLRNVQAPCLSTKKWIHGWCAKTQFNPEAKEQETSAGQSSIWTESTSDRFPTKKNHLAPHFGGTTHQNEKIFLCQSWNLRVWFLGPEFGWEARKQSLTLLRTTARRPQKVRLDCVSPHLLHHDTYRTPSSEPSTPWWKTLGWQLSECPGWLV